MLHQLLALGKELVHIYFRLGIYFLAGILPQPIFTVQENNNKFFFTLLASKNDYRILWQMWIAIFECREDIAQANEKILTAEGIQIIE